MRCDVQCIFFLYPAVAVVDVPAGEHVRVRYAAAGLLGLLPGTLGVTSGKRTSPTAAPSHAPDVATLQPA